MDDLDSKVKLKRSVKDFYRSEEGEFIVPVNDDPHARLKVNNVFVFLEGTKRRNTITRVVRFDVDTEIRMEEIRIPISAPTDPIIFYLPCRFLLL